MKRANPARPQQKRVKSPNQRVKQQEVTGGTSLYNNGFMVSGSIFFSFFASASILSMRNKTKQKNPFWLSHVSFRYRIFHILVTFKEIATMIMYWFAQQWFVVMLDESGKRDLIRKSRKSSHLGKKHLGNQPWWEAALESVHDNLIVLLSNRMLF